VTELLTPQEIPCSVEFRVRDTSNEYRIFGEENLVDNILLGEYEDVRELFVVDVRYVVEGGVLVDLW
jgi:hypothetical protein